MAVIVDKSRFNTVNYKDASPIMPYLNSDPKFRRLNVPSCKLTDFPKYVSLFRVTYCWKEVCEFWNNELLLIQTIQLYRMQTDQVLK